MPNNHPAGFLAEPTSSNGMAVLVLHAWWGLNQTIKDLCTRLAAEGFTAFAPDLYGGKVTDTIPGAEQLSKALGADDTRAKADIEASVTYLAGLHGSTEHAVSVIGFSLGAYYASEIAKADPEHVRKVVLFYGTGEIDFRNSTAAYIGHFAENDPYESAAYIDQCECAIRQAGLAVTFYRYPGVGHWFMEQDRKDAYSPDAAMLAWERTLEFFIGV